MTQQDYEKFAVLMATLAEVFDAGREVSKFKMEIYFKALERYRIDDISCAVSNMIHERVYPSFPKPAEIIQEITGKTEDKAMLAWIKTKDAIGRIGSYQSVVFDDPVIHSTIEAMGGWIDAGNWLEDEMVWKGKEFERLYSIMAPRGGHPIKLIGISERDNAANGCGVKAQTVMVGGSEQRLRLVGGKNV
jgi:hypothetical protein